MKAEWETVLANCVWEGAAKHTAWCELSEKFCVPFKCSQKRAIEKAEIDFNILVTGMNFRLSYQNNNKLTPDI